MNKVLKLCSVLVLFFLIAGCSSEGLLVSDDVNRKIVCLGDSLTKGNGVKEEDNYPSLLKKKLIDAGYDNYEVLNHGVSGDTTMDVLKRLNESISEDPDLILLEIGANDGMRKVDPIEIESNLRMIVKKIVDSDIEVLLIGMEMPINLGLKYRREFNAVYKTIEDEFDLVRVPFMLDGVANYKNLNNSDGIHPNADGYKIVVENIWEYLTDN